MYLVSLCALSLSLQSSTNPAPTHVHVTLSHTPLAWLAWQGAPVPVPIARVAVYVTMATHRHHTAQATLSEQAGMPASPSLGAHMATMRTHTHRHDTTCAVAPAPVARVAHVWLCAACVAILSCTARIPYAQK